MYSFLSRLVLIRSALGSLSKSELLFCKQSIMGVYRGPEGVERENRGRAPCSSRTALNFATCDSRCTEVTHLLRGSSSSFWERVFNFSCLALTGGGEGGSGNGGEFGARARANGAVRRQPGSRRRQTLFCWTNDSFDQPDRLAGLFLKTKGKGTRQKCVSSGTYKRERGT